MPYRLITGSFELLYQGVRRVGSRPDGDSLWFRPDAAGGLNDLGGRDGRLKAGGFARVRFEGIDAMSFQQAIKEFSAEVNTTIAPFNTTANIGDDPQFQHRMNFLPSEAVGCEQLPLPV